MIFCMMVWKYFLVRKLSNATLSVGLSKTIAFVVLDNGTSDCPALHSAQQMAQKPEQKGVRPLYQLQCAATGPNSKIKVVPLCSKKRDQHLFSKKSGGVLFSCNKRQAERLVVIEGPAEPVVLDGGTD